MKKSLLVIIILAALLAGCGAPGQSPEAIQAQVNTAVAQTLEVEDQIAKSVVLTVDAQVPLSTPTAEVVPTATPISRRLFQQSHRLPLFRHQAGAAVVAAVAAQVLPNPKYIPARSFPKNLMMAPASDPAIPLTNPGRSRIPAVQPGRRVGNLNTKAGKICPQPAIF